MQRKGSVLVGRTVLCIILDGVGAGELPDASVYHDRGSNTLANCARAVGGLSVPHLEMLGLGAIIPIDGVAVPHPIGGCYGKMAERSAGKDSTTGHWELAGLVSEKAFPLFPGGFPDELVGAFLSATGFGGILGNKPASGTVIINELGDEHCRTGFPIVYTSGDSVLQIAAHEAVIPPERLYAICREVREEVCTGPFRVGRVIARPFIGSAGSYTRTVRRRDFAVEPPGTTLLDLLHDAGIPAVGIGKIGDLFSERGLSDSIHTTTNAEGIETTISVKRTFRGGLIFTNLVDFDMLFGHRNDPRGFADALEFFDASLPRITETLGDEDLLFLTADHGNDPVTPSTDHSREYVPLLCWGPSSNRGVNLGTRTSFADVAMTIAEYLAVPDRTSLSGESFLSLIEKE